MNHHEEKKELTPREKKMETIRLLLAKAYDSAVGEYEALAFRNKARVLMDKYCIEEIGLVAPEDALPVLEEFLVLDSDIRVDRSLFTVLPNITSVIGNFFSCGTVITRRSGEQKTLLVGYAPNLKLVQYAVSVVVKQGIVEYKREYKKNPSISFGPSFWTGFQNGLFTKFRVEKSSEETGIVLYDRVKQNMDARNLGSYAPSVSGSFDAYASGTRAGESVTLNKPVSAGNGGKLLS